MSNKPCYTMEVMNNVTPLFAGAVKLLFAGGDISGNPDCPKIFGALQDAGWSAVLRDMGTDAVICECVEELCNKGKALMEEHGLQSKEYAEHIIAGTGSLVIHLLARYGGVHGLIDAKAKGDRIASKQLQGLSGEAEPPTLQSVSEMLAKAFGDGVADADVQVVKVDTPEAFKQFLRTIAGDKDVKPEPDNPTVN